MWNWHVVIVSFAAYIWISLCLKNTAWPSGCHFLVFYSWLTITSSSQVFNYKLDFSWCLQSHLVKVWKKVCLCSACWPFRMAEFNLPLKRCCDCLYQPPAILHHNQSSMKDNGIKAPWPRREKPPLNKPHWYSLEDNQIPLIVLSGLSILLLDSTK